jgi:Ca2+-binding RTX toxin-like protein
MVHVSRPPGIATRAAAWLAGVASMAMALVLPALGNGVHEFPPEITLGTLTGSQGLAINGEAGGDNFGYPVAAAGDVNGDGYGDFIIGAMNAHDGTDVPGAAYVIFGAPGLTSTPVDLATLDGSNGFKIIGAANGDSAGYSAAGAGDVNGDGFADLLVGAPYANAAGSMSGASYVVFGKAAGFAPTLALSSLNGSNGFRMVPEAANHLNGHAVGGAGDVNGDHFADVIVSSLFADASGGRIYVVFGKSAFTANLQLSGLNGGNGFRLTGVAGSNSGYAVGGGGDVNADGYDDVIIGAYNAAPHGTRTGAAYVIYGKKTGFDASLALATLDGSKGFSLLGNASDDQAGVAAAILGDVNGDGFDDIAVGAHAADPNGVATSGTTYVVFGKATAFPAEFALAGVNGTTGFMLHGGAVTERAGTDVHPAGDLNSDGYGDIAIGTYTLGVIGKGYAVFGHAPPFAANVDLPTLDGSNGFKVTGETSSDAVGRSIAAAGDTDGDGFGDLLVGGLHATGSGSESGKAYLVLGRAPIAAVTRTGADASQYISGGPLADTLAGGNGNDVLEGRAGADILQGNAGSDVASYAHAGGGVTARLANAAANAGDAAGDTYGSIEAVSGTRFNDLLEGNGSANRLSGGRGNDTLRGLAGDDVLSGGPGRDTLTGGAGHNRFAFASAADSPAGNGRDVITDFKAGSAATTVDTIDLSAVDAKTGVIGNQGFSFIGTRAFTHVKGQLRLKRSGANVIVQGDTDGNALADLEILLQNVAATSAVTAKDFRL